MFPVKPITKKPLPLSFYQRKTRKVAKELLGLKLCIKHGRKIIAAVKSSEIISSPRVGIDSAQEAVHWPLRFSVKNHPQSRKKSRNEFAPFI